MDGGHRRWRQAAVEFFAGDRRSQSAAANFLRSLRIARLRAFLANGAITGQFLQAVFLRRYRLQHFFL